MVEPYKWVSIDLNSYKKKKKKIHIQVLLVSDKMTGRNWNRTSNIVFLLYEISYSVF